MRKDVGGTVDRRTDIRNVIVAFAIFRTRLTIVVVSSSHIFGGLAQNHLEFQLAQRKLTSAVNIYSQHSLGHRPEYIPSHKQTMYNSIVTVYPLLSYLVSDK